MYSNEIVLTAGLMIGWLIISVALRINWRRAFKADSLQSTTFKDLDKTDVIISG